VKIEISPFTKSCLNLVL